MNLQIYLLDLSRILWISLHEYLFNLIHITAGWIIFYISFTKYIFEVIILYINLQLKNYLKITKLLFNYTICWQPQFIWNLNHFPFIYLLLIFTISTEIKLSGLISLLISVGIASCVICVFLESMLHLFKQKEKRNRQFVLTLWMFSIYPVSILVLLKTQLSD